MIKSRSTKVLFDIGLDADPINVLENESLSDCSESLGNTLKPIKDAEFTISSNGEIDEYHFNSMSKNYKEMRNKMLKILDESGLTIENLNEYQKSSLTKKSTRTS